MSDSKTELIRVVSEGGIAAKHLTVPDVAVLVAPSTASQHNTIKAGIIPVACWRLEDVRFEFDSSFVTPGIEVELKHLAQLVKDHPPTSKSDGKPGFPLSVFGHADPVGNDDYNKQLSGRRATAIYALLTRDTNLWENLFSQPFGNDKWGRNALQVMLDFVSTPSSDKGAQGQQPSDKGRSTTPSQTSHDEVGQHERDIGKRRQLFLKYMDQLCGPDLKLQKQDFLAGGEDTGGKGDYQGCSEFNPVLIVSQEEQKQFEQDKDKTARNDANKANRRVMVFLFRKGSRVDPNKWPCPRATEGAAGCKKRFWSDGEKRRNSRLFKDRREFEKTKDTFACRFYDRIGNDSPCERPGPLRSLFRFGFQEKLYGGNPGAVSLHLENRDGSEHKVFSMNEGRLAGSMRIFEYHDAVPGTTYKAYLLCGDRTLVLFDDADIVRIKEPGDPNNSVNHIHGRMNRKLL